MYLVLRTITVVCVTYFVITKDKKTNMLVEKSNISYEACINITPAFKGSDKTVFLEEISRCITGFILTRCQRKKKSRNRL